MEKFYKLLTYLRTTVYPAVMVYLLIAYFNWDIAWIEKQSNVISRIAFVVILSLFGGYMIKRRNYD
ncbi:hypothetical protein [Prevotella pallens]|uniref:hypothetical protein n=1 Tax=Prevotella pallens TaxID=60133 RepID=UPI0028DB4516|nr:hypothetical protein [Prevotella pallens]